MALRDAGWRVVNLACSLGRPEQQKRRGGELREACRRAGFELLIPEATPQGNAAGDGAGRRIELLDLIRTAIEDLSPRLVLAPGPHDRHPAHELLGRCLGQVLCECGDGAPRWWIWALWGSPGLPSLATAFGQERMDELLAALSAHRGELMRNDYRELVKSRASMSAILAPELLFGFGTERIPSVPYAELLTEVVFSAKRRLLGSPRWLEPMLPLAEPSDLDVGGWLDSPSPTEWLREVGC